MLFRSVNSVAFSPNGQHIVSASNDCTIRVWDTATGEEIVAGPFTGHTSDVVSVAFSPDGQRIASASGRTIRVWDATARELVAGPFTGHTSTITSVAFSPDGQRIASASLDGTISLWNAATGEVVAGPFTGHTDGVYSVAFSPDGQHVTSASADQTIRMWDVVTGEWELEAGSSTGPTKPGLFAPSSSDRQPINLTSQALTICVKGRTDTIEKVYFMDKVLVRSDGWMCGEEGELFLWVPQIHRPYLQRSNTVWIAGRHYTQLDFSKYVHGSNWATAYVHSSSK